MAKYLGLTAQIIQRMENLPTIKEVDGFVLGLAKERNLTDTKESYQFILKELYRSFGISGLTDPYHALEKLHSGIQLLQKQRLLKSQLEAVERQMKG